MRIMIMLYVVPLFLGAVAGLRALMAPTAVSWAAWSGALDLSGSWLGFLGYRWTPLIFTAAAIAELVSDKLPRTPARTVPPQFGARLVFGGLSGAAAGVGLGSWSFGLVAGIVGVVVGTLVGYRARASLSAAFGRDLPAALIEDAVAVVVSAVIATTLL